MLSETDHGSATIPPHVPGNLVRPIDLPFGPKFLVDPYGFMADLHNIHPPVFYSPDPLMGNVWVLTKHADCFHVLRNPQTFSSKGGAPFPRDPDDWFDLIPIEIEPPAHRKYRAILDPIFSPKGVMRLDAEMRRLANELIDGFINKGACEFTTAFARPFPVSVFLDLMGLPLDMRDTFVRWVSSTLHTQDPDIILRATKDISAYLKSAIEEKKLKPDSGVLSAIVHAQPGGEPLSVQEIFGFAFFVFIAGIDTVYAALNNIFMWLAQNPERRQEIRDNPDKIDAVVEELLRVFTVTFSGRNLKHDTMIHGVAMKEGERVLCVLPAANFDPEIFPNPKAVDFERPKRPILAFAGGVHSCMGAHLARLETKICLQEFLRRIPNFEVEPGAHLCYMPGAVIGPEKLPLRWNIP